MKDAANWWDKVRRNGLIPAAFLFALGVLAFWDQGPLGAVLISLVPALGLLLLNRWELSHPRGSKRLLRAGAILTALFFNLFGLAGILLGLFGGTGVGWILVPAGVVLITLALPTTLHTLDAIRSSQRT